jgi:hypothetical protein
VVPGPGLDPMVALATSLHASPGVYALLLGSGVSTGAGVPTGWEVARSLVAKVAAAMYPDDAAGPTEAADDPEGWWTEHGDGAPLGYSTLLSTLAPTSAARQALLRGYFEPTDDDRAEGKKVPGPAHHAIAQLVARGTVRLILTTNFDRLSERALEEAGISPQVLHRVEQLAPATPLAHARATVVKLHGDYADLDQLNTTTELSAYPAELEVFLRRVFDEYGLVVSGWSGDWDHALVSVFERVASRRYPLFWASYSTPGAAASQLIAQHKAVVLAGYSADEFFPGVVGRLEALDRLSDPPPTAAVAVARLKRALPDPVRRIEAFDIIDQEVSRLVTRVRDTSRHPLGGGQFAEHLSSYHADSDTLLRLLADGVFHDDGTHAQLWARALDRLMAARTFFSGAFNEHVEALRHYPALLALWVSGVACVLSQKEGLLARLLAITSKPSIGARTAVPAAYALHPVRILDEQLVNGIGRWGETRWTYPQSHLLREEAREPLAGVEPDDGAYSDACDRLEYLASLALMTRTVEFQRFPWWGEFMGEQQWSAEGYDLGAQITSEIEDAWPFLAYPGFGGDTATAKEANDRLIEWIQKHGRRW